VMETLAHHTDSPKQWIDVINSIDGLIDLAGHYAIGVLDRHQDTLRRWQQMEQALVSSNANVRRWQRAAMRVNGYTASHAGGMDDDHMKRILGTLVQCFEMMQQCTSGGLIACHLAQRYQASTRDNLRREWRQRLRACVDDIAHSVGAIVDQARSLSLGRPTASERIVMSAIGPESAGASTAAMAAAVESGDDIPTPIHEACDAYGCVGYRLRAYMTRVGTAPPPHLLITQMSAAGLPRPSKPATADGPTLSVSCRQGDEGIPAPAATTLAADHTINPIWAHECLALPLAGASGGVGVELVLHAHGERLGFARFTVNHAVGRFEGELMSDTGEPSGATVSVFYQVPSWGDTFADPTTVPAAPAALS